MTNPPSNISKTCLVTSSLSDHDMIACNRKINAHRLEPKIIKCGNYANCNMDKMNKDLSKINWQPIYNCKNVSNALELSCSTLKNVFDQHASFIEKRVKGRKCPWLTSEIREKMSDRDKLLRKSS